ncbi:hemolysin family protein [Ereboglobus sp. PH5-10]|uniref:hemolysin family protein n=1 Tax=Ereboglobus sp. PH5-10 TaxID=2940629 RepID=UPI0024067AF4|nr:hemolysin family protein [Ereboglobus sp. PH5-10]
MIWFITAIVLTIGISFCCSMLEAMILSTNVIEIEALKAKSPRHGETLEKLKNSDETISAILSLNTIANTLGSVIVGGLAAHLFNSTVVGVVSVLLTICILIFSEVIPKNIGVIHRVKLQPVMVYPLLTLCRVLRPVTYFCNLVLRLFIKKPAPSRTSDDEIILLAERGAQQGAITHHESDIIANTLSLDEVRVGEIMTPRTVVAMLPRDATVGEVFKTRSNIPFGRMPVYDKNIDDIVGIIRRRDLLKAKAADQDSELVGRLMQEAHFVPETVTASSALQTILKVHQQLLVVVDEFGSTAGVVTMEDIMEHILGHEIFEKDDVAVDMRELARRKVKKAEGMKN